MTTTQAEDFDEAVALIQAGRCPNDGGALTPMARRSGYGQCAACRFGWAAHTAPAPVIGQDAGGLRYTWYPSGYGDRWRIDADGGSREMTIWALPTPDLAPWLVAAREAE